MSVPAVDGEVTLVVQFDARPGREEELGARLRHMVAASTAEAGCLQYTLHADIEDPRRYVLYERWAGWSALEVHDQTPHVAAFVGDLPDLLVRPFDRWQLSRLTAT